MKLLFLLFVTAIIGVGTYTLSSKLFKTKKSKKFNIKSFGISLLVVVLLLSLIALGIYFSSNQADLQCGASHQVTSQVLSSPKTASDWFNQGNYQYDKGNCQLAVADYTKAIALNPKYAQAYNNRAYTNMRMRNYQDALPDLDKAIELDPTYFQALMNRGDIHNYYFAIDRQSAVTDYEKVISVVGPSGGSTNVCGHLLLAKHNGWNLGTFIGLFHNMLGDCK